MNDAAASPTQLLRLATWMSPGFPVGAFAWSHGVEAAVAEARIADGTQARDWIVCLLERGSGWNDLVLLAEGYRAAGDPERLAAVAELAEALAGSRERRIETVALGAAFAEAVRPWSDCSAAPYPVAVALAAARGGVALEPALVAYANGFASNLLSALVRLVPLGQSEAVRILHDLEPSILASASRAAASSLDDLGSCAVMSEIAAMRHETLPTRLFRS
jgi:urease accessory protein